jgi:hypothetical protein
VSLSADGNTLVVGGRYDNNYKGAAWVWTRTNDVWAQQGAKLVGTSLGSFRQGTSVSLSADGNSALIGGPADNASNGAAWVWKRTGSVWREQAKLIGTGVSGFIPEQGTSVALSADGNTAVIGAPSDHSSAEGAAWVFTRYGDSWAQQGPKLVGGGTSYSRQGEAVALSADGNTALVGGPYDNNHVGATWSWVRNGITWAQLGPKLIGTGATSGVYQGRAVSLSADGKTALIGGYGDSGGLGAAWVWAQHAGTWTQQGSKLVGAGALQPFYYTQVLQGASVALDAKGRTAIVGGPGDDDHVGAVWVWARGIGGWVQQAKLVGAGAVGRSYQGGSVSLSADGNTALVGGGGDSQGTGAAWVWTRGIRGWVQQAKLVGADAVGAAGQGQSVSLSADGNTALVGGGGDSQGTGAAWVWTRSGSIWSQQGPKLIGTGAIGAARQGRVALSADGNTAAVGGHRDDGGRGAVWVWTRSQGVWTQQAKLIGSGAFRARQGGSLSLAGDGHSLLVGGPDDDAQAGASWVWRRTPGGWIQQGAKLVGSGAVGRAAQGSSVSLSGDGTTAVVGGPVDDAWTGAAWVFALGPTPNPPTLGWRLPLTRVDAANMDAPAGSSTRSAPTTRARPDQGARWRFVASTTTTSTHEWPAQIDLRRATAASLRVSSSLSTRASWGEVRARPVGGAWRTLVVLSPTSAAGTITLDMRAFLGRFVDVQLVFHALAPGDGAAPDSWTVDDVRTVVTVAAP